MTPVRGTRVPALADDALTTAVAEIRAPLLDGLEDGDHVVLVPDVHYPYHPTTGMVTNPEVVSSLLSSLRSRLPNATFVIALRSSPVVETARTASYLGYESLSQSHEVALDRLDEASTRRVDAGSERVAIPDRLLDGAVIPVPSARIAGALPMAGSLAVLSTAVGLEPDDAAVVRDIFQTVEPAGAVVDATYTFTGEPYRARALFAGGDALTVESLLAGLLGVDTAAVPGLSGSSSPASESDVAVDGLDVESLAAELPDGDLPASTDPHRLVQTAYRMYASVSGDVFPPQLRGDR